MRRLMVRFGADQAASEKAAQAVLAKPASQPVEVIDAADGVSLRIAQGFDRAWRGVGLGLDRGGFTVEDRNRSDGVYFVRYIDSDQANEEPGFFARLFGGKDNTAPQKYRLIVAGQGDVSTLTVQADDGTALGAEQKPTVRRMLNVLRDQMLR
ncbi:MAG: outer membrane protein assembly factor BamC [Burkholderiaceae bacterium]